MRITPLLFVGGCIRGWGLNLKYMDDPLIAGAPFPVIYTQTVPDVHLRRRSNQLLIKVRISSTRPTPDQKWWLWQLNPDLEVSGSRGAGELEVYMLEAPWDPRGEAPDLTASGSADWEFDPQITFEVVEVSGPAQNP
jgi:hypothetical protein